MIHMAGKNFFLCCGVVTPTGTAAGEFRRKHSSSPRQFIDRSSAAHAGFIRLMQPQGDPPGDTWNLIRVTREPRAFARLGAALRCSLVPEGHGTREQPAGGASSGSRTSKVAPPPGVSR